MLENRDPAQPTPAQAAQATLSGRNHLRFTGCFAARPRPAANPEGCTAAAGRGPSAAADPPPSLPREGLLVLGGVRSSAARHLRPAYPARGVCCCWAGFVCMRPLRRSQVQMLHPQPEQLLHSDINPCHAQLVVVRAAVAALAASVCCVLASDITEHGLSGV